MQVPHDLVIRGGTIADGTGGAMRQGDIAVTGGRIVHVGEVTGRGTEEIDASHLVVTPGFIDLHTHYDGQATWESRLVPSSWHGVTTAVIGNCGVGFAPVKPEDRERLIELMEGVEDIPGVVLKEGLDWRWESFGDFMDVLESRERDVDICAQLAHGPMRIFVMGERAVRLEEATTADIAAMRQLAADAVREGAIGFSSSRTINHRTARGENTPSLRALDDELLGIALGLRDAGGGVLQLISDWDTPDMQTEFALMRRLVRESGCPLSFSLGQRHATPDEWKKLLAHTDAAQADGLDIRPQVAPRPVGVVLGLQGSITVFSGYAAYREIEHLPLAEKLARMRAPEFRQRLRTETPAEPPTPFAARLQGLDCMFPLGTPPNYEPDPRSSVAHAAQRKGCTPLEAALDYLLEGKGENLLFVPIANYAELSLDVCGEMMGNPWSLFGLGDGGAHVSLISDASFTTYALSHWGRDRAYGRFPIEWLVQRLTSASARHLGLTDRGLIAPGMKADLNVIDIDRLGNCAPHMTSDLPAGGKRLLQKSHGYRWTIVNGVPTYRDGEATGALPGRLVRRRGSGAHGTPAR